MMAASNFRRTARWAVYATAPFWLAAGPAAAQSEGGPSDALIVSVDIPYERFTLANGLTVIVHTDRKVPVVAVSVAYHVGSKDELPGRTGFAHLFEHLMFQGSEHYNEDWLGVLQAMGATDLNGTTSPDRTYYYQNVPTPALERILFLESDRMGHLLGAVDQTKLDSQRAVVQNEMRQVENQPYGKAYYRLLEGLYPAGHPYRHSEIGSMADLNAATLEDVKTFFRNWYGPNNAVLTLAGDIDAATARPLVEKYFGAIAPGPAIPQRLRAWAPDNDRIVRETMEDQVAAPRIYRAWAAPGINDPAAQELQVAAIILGGGDTARLHTRLVGEEQLATSVSGFVASSEAASMVRLQIDVKPGVDPELVGRRVDEIVDQFLAEGPTVSEVNRVTMDLVSSMVRGLEQVGGFSGKASTLAHGELFADNPHQFKTTMRRYAAATPDSVRATARRWMDDGDYQLLVLPYGNLHAASASIDRSQLPPIAGAPKFDFPELERARLSNGIEVVFARRTAVPVVQLSMTFDAGTAADPRDQLGTQRLMLSLIDKRTDERTAAEIAEAQQALGAYISSSTGYDTTEINLSALTANLAPSLALWADVIRDPVFAAEDLERERAIQIAAIAQDQNTPAAVAQRLLPPLLYGDHPYGVPTSGRGTAEAVKSLTRDDLQRFRARWIRPDNANIFAVGDVTLAQLMPMLEKQFGDWETPSVPRGTKTFTPVTAPQQSRIILVDRPGSPQSFIAAGMPLAMEGTGDVLALQLANFPFGANFTSRLNTNLRENKGWSYGVSSSIAQTREQMPFTIYAPVQTDQTGPALSELLAELRAYTGDRPITEAETKATVSSLTGSLPGAYESAGAVLNAMQTNALLGRPDDYEEISVARMQALTREQLAAALRQQIDPTKLIWVVVGDRAKIEPQLKTIGLPIEVRTVN